MANHNKLHDLQLVFLGSLTLSAAPAAASDWVDARGFDSVTLMVKSNTVTAAGAGVDFTVEHGDDSTAAGAALANTATDLVGVSFETVEDADDDKILGRAGYVGSKRYVRLVGTGADGAVDASVDVYAILDLKARSTAPFIGTSVAAT